jgi:hypothetical protein
LRGLGLTEAEYRLIREDLTPESRCFLIKQGNTSIVAKLDLGGMKDELLCCRAAPKPGRHGGGHRPRRDRSRRLAPTVLRQ